MCKSGNYYSTGLFLGFEKLCSLKITVLHFYWNEIQFSVDSVAVIIQIQKILQNRSMWMQKCLRLVLFPIFNFQKFASKIKINNLLKKRIDFRSPFILNRSC